MLAKFSTYTSFYALFRRHSFVILYDCQNSVPTMKHAKEWATRAFNADDLKLDENKNAEPFKGYTGKSLNNYQAPLLGDAQYVGSSYLATTVAHGPAERNSYYYSIEFLLKTMNRACIPPQLGSI
jgi:hypothetical protein